jgi:hypothetical protein
MTTIFKGVAASPKISDAPRHHPDCCLSLSTKLIQQIGQLQPPGSLVLSIGSGSGLLETLVQRHYPQTRVVGLEVNDLINKYLSPDNAISVKGTWDIYTKSSEADTWLFVYPKSPALISRYLELSKIPKTTVWLGPKRDWEDFRSPFLAYRKFTIEEVEDAGLASYETMFVITTEDSASSINTPSLLSPSQISEI